jgi:hypothetical protein
MTMRVDRNNDMLIRIFLIALLVSIPVVACAEEVQLFNGKDLSNWTWVPQQPGSKLEDVWTIREGGILRDNGRPIGYIRTNDDYTSFVLKCEWRFVGKPGNGGVLLRAQQPDEVWPRSIEAQLESKNAGDIWNIGQFPMKVDASRTQGRRTQKLRPSNEKPLGEWNQYEITLDGGHLKLVVNGELQNEATDVQVVPGKICLQAEGAEMELRNIVLTPLESREPKASTAIPGWHATGAGSWSMHDGGVIVGKHSKQDKAYGHLVSDRTYKDFAATLKFKALAGNSGVYFRYVPDDKGGVKSGFQAEIDATKDIGGIYESGGRGWVAQPKEKDVREFFRPNEWNEMSIRATGPRVVVTVNGRTVSDINDEKNNREGPIALQLHGGIDDEVQFKGLQIVDLAGGK